MSQYSKTNNRKRQRPIKTSPKGKEKEERKEETSTPSIKPTHSCPWNSGFASFSDMDPAAVSKLIAELQNLKAHLTSAHSELKEISRYNIKFQKSVKKHKKKLDLIDKVAFGTDAFASDASGPEPSTSTSAKKKLESSESEDESSSTSGNVTPARPARPVNFEDEGDDSEQDDEDDVDDDVDEGDDDDEEDDNDEEDDDDEEEDDDEEDSETT